MKRKTNERKELKNQALPQNLIHIRKEDDVINFHTYADQLTDGMIMMAGYQ